MENDANIKATEYYYVDTNVLLDKISFLETEGFKFVILSHVMREIENFCSSKVQDRDLSFKARNVRRYIRANQDKFKIDLKDYSVDLSEELDGNYTDNKILQACVENGYGLVTHDVLLQIKGSAYGLSVIDPDDQGVYSGGYKGWSEFEFDTLDDQTDFYNNPQEYGLYTNEYVAVHAIEDGKIKLHRFDGEKLVNLKFPVKKKNEDEKEFVVPQNFQQMFALDMLNNNDIPIKFIIGTHGSGKTYMTVKTAVRDVVLGKMGKKRNAIMMVRNPVGSGKEIGFLKGTKDDKTADFFKPFIQHLEGGEIEAEMLEKVGQLKKEIPFYMKGLSIEKTFIIVDEAEDLTRKIIKHLGTRVAEDSLIVFSGDIEQAEDEFARNNGLRAAIETLKGNPLVAIVCLDEDVRSEASKAFTGL